MFDSLEGESLEAGLVVWNKTLGLVSLRTYAQALLAQSNHSLHHWKYSGPGSTRLNYAVVSHVV
jgi:hypothetical protein